MPNKPRDPNNPISDEMQARGRLGGRPKKNSLSYKEFSNNLNMLDNARRNSAFGLGIRRIPDPVANPRAIKPNYPITF